MPSADPTAKCQEPVFSTKPFGQSLIPMAEVLSVDSFGHVAANLAIDLVEFVSNFSTMVAHWKCWWIVNGWNG